jgi:hypothetical protein
MKKKETVILFEFGLPDVTINLNGTMVNLKGKNFDIILSVIAVYTIYQEPNKNGYVEISSKVFKGKLSNYSPYIDYLISQGMIEKDYFLYVDNNRVSSKSLYDKNQTSKCYGYRFSWGFSKSVNVVNTIYYQKTAGDKYQNYIDKIKPKNQITENTPDIYINPETLKRLKRDFNSAKVVSLIPPKTNIENSKYLDMGKWFDNVLKLHKWKNISRSFHFSTNRLYTSFTSLSSTTREKNISLSNMGIIEFDIKNSFPLFISVYCLQQFPGIINDYDFTHYCELVKNGIFYEEMEKLLNRSLDCDTNRREEQFQKKLDKSKKLFEKEGIKTIVIDNRDTPKRKLTRNIVKELFQIYLNGKLNRSPMVKGYGDSFIKDQMKNYFGCIDEQITSIKESEDMVYHKIVALETRFIFDIIEELYQSYPDIRILTTHDCISFPLNYQNEVQEVWDKHMNRLYASLPGELLDNDEEDYEEYCFEEIFGMEDYEETPTYQIPPKTISYYEKYVKDFDFNSLDDIEGDNEDEDDFDWFYN